MSGERTSAVPHVRRQQRVGAGDVRGQRDHLYTDPPQGEQTLKSAEKVGSIKTSEKQERIVLLLSNR